MSRRGFTLIELLVSIAIMAVMAAMMIPAVQSARRSAQAIRCRANLAQLGEAFHAYHLTQGSLPPGTVDQRSPAVAEPNRFVWGWAIQLLPQLGESNRYRALDPRLGVLAAPNTQVLAVAPSRFQCPVSSARDPYGYAGCHNDQPGQILESNSGVLTLNSRVRFQDLPDGLHQTILLGEAAEVRWAEGAYGSLRSIGEPWGALPQAAKLTRESAQQLRKVRSEIREELVALDEARKTQLEQIQSDYPPPPPAAEPIPSGDEMELPQESASQEMDAPSIDGMMTDGPDLNSGEGGSGMVMMPDLVVDEGDSSMGESAGDGSSPPPPPTAELLPPSTAFGFWPAHHDGGHFLLVDGSVRLISQNIDREILRRLANRLDTRDPGAF